METAGRAVVFSGTTVAIGLLALVALPLPFLRAMGYGGMLIPLVSTLVAITLLPVVLAKLGQRLDWPHRRTDDKREPRLDALGRVRRAPPRGRRGRRDRDRRRARGRRHQHPARQLRTPTRSPSRATRSRASSRSSGPGIGAGRADAARGAGRGLEPRQGGGRRCAARRRARRGRPAEPRLAPRRHRGRRRVRHRRQRDRGRRATRSTRVRDAAHARGPDVRVGGSPAQNADFIDAVYGSFPLMIALIAIVTFVLLARAFRSLLLPRRRSCSTC